MLITNTPNQPKKLLELVSDRIRAKKYSIRTETQYVQWVKRFVIYHNKKHPALMGYEEIEAYLTYLAVEGHVSASTQNQALAALLFANRMMAAIKQMNAAIKDALYKFIIVRNINNAYPITFDFSLLS